MEEGKIDSLETVLTVQRIPVKVYRCLLFKPLWVLDAGPGVI